MPYAPHLDAADDAIVDAGVFEHGTLGPYELLVPMGRGGMGVVWAARRSGSDEIVAVKTLVARLSAEPRFARMLRAEADIASHIRHPNVCKVLGVGDDRGVLYVVMEWVDGEPLSWLCEASETSPVPYGVVAAIIAQAARGLGAAHELRSAAGEPSPVIHRDVSPHNILVTSGGAVKIVDFGIAKAARGTDQTTESGYIKGKVAYLSPEQVAQERVDARADVFALGTVLYELSVGTHPFRRSTELGTLLAIGSAEHPPKPDHDGYPPELWRVVERALQREPAQRYGSMRELADDLEAFAGSRPSDGSVAGFLAEICADRAARRGAAIEAACRAVDARRPARRWTSRPMLVRALAIGVLGAAVGAAGLRATQASVGRPAGEPATVSATPGASAAPRVETSIERSEPSIAAEPKPAPEPEPERSPPSEARRGPSPAARPRALSRDASPAPPAASATPAASAPDAPSPAGAAPASRAAEPTRFRDPDF